MHQVAPDEFCMVQGDLALWFTGYLPSGGKSDRIIGNGKDPAVRNSNLVGITPEVFNGIAKTVKGLFDVGAPVHSIKAVFPFFPVIGITQLFTGRRKCKYAVFVKRGKAGHIFSFKFVPQYFCADKKVFGRFSDLPVFRKPAAGDDAVHVHMVTQLLVPCVEHLDDTGCCPKPLLIGR